MILPRKRNSARAVAHHYDDLDPYYREIWGEHVHHGLWLKGSESVAEATVQLVDYVGNQLDLKSGDALCDIGCGYGAGARRFAAAFGAIVTGLTLSRAQFDIAAAAQRNERVRFEHADWVQNELGSESFDALTAIESVSHVEDKQRFFDEACRVLRPGGRMAICCWLSAETPSARHVRWLLEPICREGRLAGLGTADEYTRWITCAGLAVLSFEDLSTFVRKTWPTCIRRTAWAVLRRPQYIRSLLDPTWKNRVFALTMIRVWIAYRRRCLKYGMFVLEKPAITGRNARKSTSHVTQ